MFLHVGVIHIAFNMLLQVTLGRDMEKSIGPIRFLLVYLSAGIFGFVLGGNFSASGVSSAGASGSLFGVIALTLLDLLYTWSDRPSPVKDLLFILLDVVISFVLGLLPGLDNFSHIGGFAMGLVLGICILHSPPALRRRIGADDPPYQSVAGGAGGASGVVRFVKAPVGFFKGRKPAWWAWWLLRVAALVLVLVLFIVLLNNFYIYRKTCGWCKYLSCLVSSCPLPWRRNKREERKLTPTARQRLVRYRRPDILKHHHLLKTQRRGPVRAMARAVALSAAIPMMLSSARFFSLSFWLCDRF
jgi:hypothetical protein